MILGRGKAAAAGAFEESIILIPKHLFSHHPSLCFCHFSMVIAQPPTQCLAIVLKVTLGLKKLPWLLCGDYEMIEVAAARLARPRR
jgi:hypothetical protein